MELKICAISDLHGHLPKITKSANILLIAGDISPLYIQRNILEMEYWLQNDFMSWLKELPVGKVYLVPGNHDFVFENRFDSFTKDLEELSGGKLVYLSNETITHIDNDKNEWTIFGTGYCHIFGNWPFMRPDSFMVEKFKEIPDKVDIIISHDPPHGIGQVDQILETTRWSNQTLESLGNIPLSKRISDVDFKLLVCGHIHSGDHTECDFNGGKVVNVSIKNEDYKPTYDHFYYTITK